MILRVPNKLLKKFEDERGLSYVVQITAHMVGEMKRPASILVDEKDIRDDVWITLLSSEDVKEVK